MKAVKAEPTKRLTEEAVEWMVVTALHHVKLTEREDVLAKAKAKEVKWAVDNLELAGCNREKLLNMVAIARELPTVSPKFKARDFKTLADDIENVLARMKRLTPFTDLSMADDDYIDSSFPLGRLRSWQEFEQQFLRMKQVCETLIRLCKSTKPKTILERFGYLVPVVYVHYSTTKYSTAKDSTGKLRFSRSPGKPHYKEVAQLLSSLANIEKNENQLRRDYKWAESDYPAVVWWLRRGLDVVIEEWLGPCN